jgi:hypothetical protein
MLKTLIVRLFGMRVQPFLWVNLALHVANVWLLFLLARRLIGLAECESKVGLRADAGAFVAALLFGLNPMRVEPVAWASGQSYVLAGTFLLLSVWTYLRYCELRFQQPRTHYSALFLGLSVLAYLCAVLSKSAAIFLPPILLLLDYYPLRRRLEWRLAIEKLPHFVLGGALGFTALWATAGAQTGNSFELSLLARVAYALHSLLFHLGMALWPAEPLPFYPIVQPEVTPWSDPLLQYTAGSAALFVLSWQLRQRAPGLLVAWGSYALALFPVSGLLSHGALTLGADRYTYLTLFGVWIVLAAILTSRWLLPDPIAATPRSRWLVAGLVILLAIWGLSTWRATWRWRNTTALWTHTLAKDPANPMALNNLGFHYLAQERYRDAIPLLRTTLVVDPKNLKALLNLGFSLEKIGDLNEALRVYREGLAVHPQAPALHNNLGVVYHTLGQHEEGEAHLARAKALGFER